ncbi:hypothetical protein [Dysgonomonas macrotermitis]|nr:hypothetical protein [Dysgonomonas macrotermitis]
MSGESKSDYYDKTEKRKWLNTGDQDTFSDKLLGIHLPTVSVNTNNFERKRHEIQVIRDFADDDFGFDNKLIAGFYDKPNLPQDNVYNNNDPENYPIWHPQRYNPMIIDPSAEERLINGLHFGRTNRSGTNDLNPAEINFPFNTMFIKNGFSWDKTFSQKTKIHSAYHNPYLYHWNGSVDEDPENEEESDTVTIKYDLKEKYNTVITGIPEEDLSYIQASEPDDIVTGEGQATSIIWLEKGERITVCWVSESGDKRTSFFRQSLAQGPIAVENMDFELTIEPFRTDVEWITIDNNGEGTAPMDWNAPSNFQREEIDLIKFLPSEQKVDEWLDNFCKAFNLQLTQDDEGNFELNVKQKQVQSHSDSAIDLDKKASITGRSNQPLGLPAVFDLGFKINEEERGFVDSKKQYTEGNNGGGKIETGSIDGSTISQTSSFSYNWFKNIDQEDSNRKQTLKVPLISNHEIWLGDPSDYKEMVSKVYTNYAQRFWYINQEGIYDLGPIWKTETTPLNDDKALNLYIPQLTDTLSEESTLTLNYKNQKNSILHTYFNVLATNDSNYTEIECYLTPDEYERLDGTALVKLNNDLYYIASIEGYDPIGINKTKLKLIRKL